MAVAFVSVGTVGIGSTSVTAGLPASLATGDGVLLRVMTKPDTATIATPTDWTLVADVAGGGGTQGNGTGPSRQAVFFREKTAAWSAMPAVSVTSGNASAAIAERWTKSAANLWSIAAATGSYSGDSTAWSATMGSDPGLTSGDGVSVGCSNQDEGPTWSAQAITATGATFGSVTEQSEAVETTTGQDLGGMVFTAMVTAGTASAVATVTATCSAASRGTTALVRLREQPPPGYGIGSDVAFSDNFNRTDGAVGANYAQLNGASLTVVSNEVASPDANTNHMRTVTGASSSDMYAEAVMRAAGSGAGVGARFTTSNVTETGYVWRYNGTNCQLFVVSAGSFTSIGSAYTATLSAGAILRIEVEGTAIRGYVNGVLQASTTNSTVTTGTGGSLRLGGTAARMDNFYVGRLGGGLTTYVGTAAGSAPVSIPDGTGTGTFTFAGSASGQTTKSGTGSGTLAYSGAAVGDAPSIPPGQGTGSGTWSTTGSAAGSSARRGIASGTWAIDGTASGSTAKSGTGTGTWAYVGTADGQTTKSGTGAGTFTFSGEATGATVKRGTAGGFWAWVGSAAGLAPVPGVKQGSGLGTWSFSGTGFGSMPALPFTSGSGTGAWAYVGTAVGSAAPPVLVPTPATRTRVIPAETRRRVIAADLRVRTIPAEDRTRTIPADRRSRAVAAEPRTRSVPSG